MPRKRDKSPETSGQGKLTDVLIPEKHFFRIGEVSELTQLKSYVLRFWETEFPTLKPVKSATGHRLYRREDVQAVLEIKRLLYDEGYTIEGARKELARGTSGNATQKDLFRPRPASLPLGSIRKELQGILTLLGRKC
jgi:DNA-binding transcriptional MerR regulator